MAGPDYSSIYGGIDKNAAYQKQQAAQAENANKQGQLDALQRRQAQLSGGPGGAFVKAEQDVDNQSAQRLNAVNQGIDTQTDQAKQGIQMTQLGQQYQTSEREAGQQFAQGQQQAQFGHESELQQAGFANQKQLQDAQIAAQEIMQDKGINAQSSLQDKQIAAQELMQKTGIDAAAAQQLVGIQAQKDLQTSQQNFQKPFMEAQVTGMYNGQETEEKRVDDINADIAYKQLAKKDALEQLLGNKWIGIDNGGALGALAQQWGIGGAGGNGGTPFGGSGGSNIIQPQSYGSINGMFSDFGGGGGGDFSVGGMSL